MSIPVRCVMILQTIDAEIYLCLEWDSNQRSQFEPSLSMNSFFVLVILSIRHETVVYSANFFIYLFIANLQSTP
jgi:hypothetical protein